MVLITNVDRSCVGKVNLRPNNTLRVGSVLITLLNRFLYKFSYEFSTVKIGSLLPFWCFLDPSDTASVYKTWGT